MVRICVFGDSIAWGAWDEEQGGWVERLRRQVNWKNEDFETEIYNLGISTNTTSDLLERFETEAHARKPDVILFYIGENDAGYIGDEAHPFVEREQFDKNIAKLIRLAKKYTTRFVFIGFSQIDESMTKPVPWANHFFTNERSQSYEKELKKRCAQEKVPFLDIRKLLARTDYCEDDTLHPNAHGHEKIFKIVLSFLQDKKWI